MKRQEAVATALHSLKGEWIIHCNGMISREAFHTLDQPESFYMIGSMGLTGSIALGIALCRPDQRIFVFDGDGNVLMNLGTLAEAGAFRPANFYHLCFDNGVYGSTGNQPTISRMLDLAEIARSAGFRTVRTVSDPEELKRVMGGLLREEGPVFLHIKVRPDPVYETAPRVTLSPEEIRDRFRASVGGR